MSASSNKSASSSKNTSALASFLEESVARPKTLWQDARLLAELWPYARPHQGLLWLSAGLLIPVTLSQIALPLLVRRAIDGPIAHGDGWGLTQVAAIYAGVMALHYVCRYWLMSVSQNAGQLIVYHLRTALYRHLQTLSPRFYQKTPIGRLVTRVTGDVENLSEMFASGGLTILLDAAMIVGVLAAIFWQHALLAAVVTGMLVVIMAVMEWLRRKARGAYERIRHQMGALNGFMQENFAGVEVTQICRREARNVRDFQGLNAENLAANLQSVRYDFALSASVEFLTIATQALILATGALALSGMIIAQPPITLGLLAAFFLYAQMVFEPVEDLAEKYTLIQSGLASLARLTPLFREHSDLLPSSQGVLATSPTSLPSQASFELRAALSVAFEGVTFGYSADRPVLRDVSFRVAAGETVAIIGPTGAGKSTIIKLLNRFYDPQAGRILLGDDDVRQLPLRALRQRIGVIQQDDQLFSRSIAENLTLDPIEAEDPAMEAALWRALETVSAADWVRALPQGLQTRLSERGSNLSAGERQLLLFARALTHDPPVLALDEATSSIDSRSEQRLQQAMNALQRGRTTLTIAHRLSTIRQADRILVIADGCVAEEGGHEALLAQDGLYARYYAYHCALEVVR
ncbi:MAG: ABC transporter ATP-binding protein [Vampirovibrionales bacterium]|nr:ABC transporter ATP-binding protein [Vampirovibrionales bacterium]